MGNKLPPFSKIFFRERQMLVFHPPECKGRQPSESKFCIPGHPGKRRKDKKWHAIERFFKVINNLQQFSLCFASVSILERNGIRLILLKSLRLNFGNETWDCLKRTWITAEGSEQHEFFRFFFVVTNSWIAASRSNLSGYEKFSGVSIRQQCRVT